MPSTFAYKVRDGSGKLISGSLEAENTALVVSRLKEMGYLPISVDKKSAAMNSDINIPGLSGRVKAKEIALFSREFATLIDAGISLTRALSILGGQTDNKQLATVIDQVRSDVENGSSLSEALVRHPRCFGRLYVAMVRAGETGGNLDRTLRDLSETLEKQVELRRKIKTAMTYPVAVLGIVGLIMAIMLLYVVPIFKKMYKQLGGTLPAPTRLLVGLSNLLATSLPFVIIGVVVAAILFRRWLKTPSGRRIWDTAVLRVPVFGGLMRKTALARFSSTLSTLLSSGVSVLEALEITRETAGNTLVSDGIDAIADGARRGEPMHQALEDFPVFPPMVTQMMAIGEETGALDSLLAKVATFLQQEIEATVGALTALLEPLMILVLGSAVGFVVVSLYLPMFDIYKLVSKNG